MKNKTIFLIMLGFIIYLIILISPQEIPETEQDIILKCSNQTLEETSKCLVNKVKTFYKFREIDDNIKLNFEELKEFGGDCRNWAFFYERIGKKLNFVTSTVGIDKNGINGLDHRFTMISDGKDYCILDQLNYWCNDLG